ncbi:hypothetical protein RDI58_022014 [Solanum bulbocastanum]|uniref:Uncharacterized protein n=1 Tax=Solanum bulbocastanum TaxID=147425 RepID=A0AAN8Y4V0_SOLBU
MILQDKQIY